MSLAAKQSNIGTFSNNAEWVQVVYDYSVDGGATGDYDIINAGQDLVILDFYADVQAAVTSAGSLVMDLGVDAGGTELWSNKAVADLSLDSLHGMDTAAPVRVAADSEIVVSIDAAAATAGKIAFNFLVKKV